MTPRRRRLLLAWGIASTLAMLYFLGRWLSEAAGPSQTTQLVRLLVAAAIALPPCIALAIATFREGAGWSRTDRHLNLTPALAWLAIAALALLVWLPGT